jgi:AcrR family transcriptional regulator
MAAKAWAAPNKHQQRTEATRRKLLNAALRVFARDGFEAARIEDIAAEAGHTRGAFYANFEAKEDLFLALLEQQAGKRTRELEALLERCATPEEWRAAVRGFYLKRVADRQWAMLTLEFKLFALRHGNMRARLAAAHRRIRSSLNSGSITKRWLDEHCGGGEFPEMYKATLEAALSGLTIEHAYDPKRISAEQVISILSRIFDMLVGA